jgi:hypothetical protein
MSRHASLQQDNVPTQNALTGTGSTMVSLWQTNCVAIEALAWFAALRIRSNAVAAIDAIAWA